MDQKYTILSGEFGRTEARRVDHKLGMGRSDRYNRVERGRDEQKGGSKNCRSWGGLASEHASAEKGVDASSQPLDRSQDEVRLRLYLYSRRLPRLGFVITLMSSYSLRTGTSTVVDLPEPAGGRFLVKELFHDTLA